MFYRQFHAFWLGLLSVLLMAGFLPTAQAAADGSVAARNETLWLSLVSDADGHPAFADQHGKLYPARVQRSDRVTTDENGQETHATSVLVAAIPRTDAEEPVGTLATGTSGGCEYDNSFIVYMCLTQYWSDYFSGGHRYVAVSKYTAKWTIADSQFSLRQGRIRAAVFGRCGQGCSGTLSASSSRYIDYPTPGTTYTYSSFSWVGDYVDVTPNPGYQCGDSSITVRRTDATTYTLWHSDVCQGAP